MAPVSVAPTLSLAPSVSFTPTAAYQAYASFQCVIVTTTAPTVSPTNTPAPSTAKPSKNPVNFPTKAPGAVATPTAAPSVQTVPVVSFTSALTFSGFETNAALSAADQDSITITVCKSMGLGNATNACSYVGTTFTAVSSRRKLRAANGMHMLTTTYDALTTVQVQLILASYPLYADATALRDALATSLSTAVTSGTFATTLATVGQDNGSARVLQATPTGVTTSTVTVVAPPTLAPTSAPKKDDDKAALSTGAIIGIAVGGGVGLIIIIFVIAKFACGSSSKVGVSN